MFGLNERYTFRIMETRWIGNVVEEKILHTYGGMKVLQVLPDLKNYRDKNPDKEYSLFVKIEV